MRETFHFAGALTTILVWGEQTACAFSLHETMQPPGGTTPPHVHAREDETAYVVSGTLTVETEHQMLHLAAGSARLLPRGISHRLSNRGTEDVRYVVFCTPAGFDKFVREAGERSAEASPAPRPMTPEERARLASAMARHRISFVADTDL